MELGGGRWSLVEVDGAWWRWMELGGGGWSWVEVDGAGRGGWSRVEVDEAGWRWVHGLATPNKNNKKN